MRNTFVNSIDISNCRDDEILNYIEFDPKLNGLSIDENLDFTNRQLKYIHPHVLFEGLDYKTPFLQNKWVELILSLMIINTEEIASYTKVLDKYISELFNYPIKIIMD